MEGPPHYLAIQRHRPQEAVALVEQALGARVRRVAKDRLGASHAIYFLTLDDGREVVARLAIHAGHDLARDLWATELCRRRGVPAPEVLFARTDPAAGTPFAVLSRLPGRTAKTGRLTGRRREAALEQMGRHLARMHRIRLDGCGELRPVAGAGARVRLERRYAGRSESIGAWVLDGVAGTLAELDSLRGHPSWPPDALPPAQVARLRDCFAAARPLLDAPAAVLVHGDYRLKNALLAGDEITGIVDFELVVAGDPAMDLSWLRFQDVQTGADWAAVCRGYGLLPEASPEASLERRLLLYEVWWGLRRLWWEVMIRDPEGIAESLATVNGNLARLLD